MNKFFFWFVLIQGISAAGVKSAQLPVGIIVASSNVLNNNVQYHPNAPMFNQMSARCLQHSGLQQPLQLRYSQSPAIQILKTQSLQVKSATSPVQVSNNITIYTNYANTLPKALLHQSIGYLQNGAISGKTISTFRHINNGLSVHFDKPLPVLRSELASANSLKNSIFQEFLQNGFTTDEKFASFAKAEMLVDQLQFVVKVKEECLTHALAQLQPYENALKLAVENTQLCLPNSTEYKLLEQQELLLKSSLQQDQALLAKHEVMLRGIEKELASLDTFFNVFERDALADVKNSKIVVSEIIQQEQARITACNTELSRLRPILANVKQANVEHTMAANTLPVNTIVEPVTTAITDVKQEVISNTPSQLQSDKDVMLSTEYRVNPETAVSLQALDYDVNKEFIVEFKGNHVQHYVHNKLKESLVKIGSVKQTTVEVKELLKSAINFNKIGQTLNIYNKTNDALAAQNTSDKIADYAAALADAGLAIGEGVLEGTKSTAHFIVDTIDLATLDPQAIERVKISFDAASQAASQFMARLDSWLDLKLTPGQENKARQIRNDYLESLGKSIAAKIVNTPARDQIKAIAQFATEWLLLGKVGKVFGSAAHVGKVMTEEKIINPLKSLVCEVAEATAKTLESNSNLVQQVLGTVEKEVEYVLLQVENTPLMVEAELHQFQQVVKSEVELASAAPQLANSASEVAELVESCCKYPHPLRIVNAEILEKIANGSIKELSIAEIAQIPCAQMSKDIMKHIMYGDINLRRARVSGFHHGHKYPELFLKESLPDAKGVYRIQWTRGNLKSKPSTCVPKNMNMVEHKKAIMQAYYNPCEAAVIDGPGIIVTKGMSDCGIVFEIISELSAGKNLMKIKTAYPLYNYMPK